MISMPTEPKEKKKTPVNEQDVKSATKKQK